MDAMGYVGFGACGPWYGVEGIHGYVKGLPRRWGTGKGVEACGVVSTCLLLFEQ